MAIQRLGDPERRGERLWELAGDVDIEGAITEHGGIEAAAVAAAEVAGAWYSGSVEDIIAYLRCQTEE